MSQVVSIVRKVAVLVVGVPIVVIGIILVPLPGPGLLIMFVGLFIISLEFEWAQKHVDNIKARLGALVDKARSKN